VIGDHESAGAIISGLLPKGARLAKALGSLSAASLSNAAFQQPERAVLFYTTDDVNINTAIEALIQDSGFAPLRVGTIDQSIRIEVFGDLHEYGALGKTVTLAEVKDGVLAVH
jgi:8-hydroxy-5-deazaflavin:NADPH oxidoreductase